MDNIRGFFACAVVTVLGVLLLDARSYAGTTGNLTGKVTDLTTGEVLPGVNIIVVSSGRGAVTNTKGEYSIVGITPGTYLIRASLVGYKPAEAKKGMIEADQTAVYNFKMASEEVQMEGVTVEGQRPMVDTRKTAGDQTFNKDKIEQLPNLKGVEDVLTLQTGVVKFGAQLFLRGGRANETQILVDGVPVNDVGGSGSAAGTAAANEQLQQFYSGTSGAGGGGALSVAANAIASVSVSSSGLDAEYGNAQSGVVNVTTKTGAEKYAGSFQYRTDGLVGSGFNDRFYAGDISGPEPLTQYLLPALGLEVPGNASLFISSTFNQSDGPYGWNVSQFYNPVRRKIRFGGLLGGLLDKIGFTYNDRQSNNFSFNSKLTYQPGENDQLTFSYRANASSSHPLAGYVSWLNRSDSSVTSIGLQTQNVFQWTHVLGTNALIKGYVSRLEIQSTSTVGDLTPPQFASVADLSGFNPSQTGFYDLGTGQSWSTGNTVIWNAKLDYNAQVHPLHFLKTGAEYFYEVLRSTVISFPNAPPDKRLADSLSQRGLYPGYGIGRWVGNNIPSRGALYVQDNIEMTGLNIHVGLRYDFFYLGKQVFSPDFVSRWKSLANPQNDPLGERPDWLVYESFWSQFVRGYMSPRLSIGYPVSRTTVFYFNYGHFLQNPERDQLFHDPVPTTLGGNYIGNPSLKPQKTVQYEAGFDQLLFEDLSVGVRGFYKDIFDYVTLRTLPVTPTINKFVNLDYASTRGFEIIVNKGSSDHYSGSIGYTFQLAKGRSSNPFAAASSSQLQGLPREVRLDYDQQHTVNLFLGYRVGPKEDYSVFGIPLNNWGVSLTWNFGSGFPYTPYNLGKTLEDLYLVNTGDGPYSSELNVSAFKGFKFFDALNLVFTLDVINLLNRKNVDLNGGGFNTMEGRPLIFGDYRPDTRVIYNWNGQSGNPSFSARVPPFIFRSPRQITLGMKVTWD